MNFIYCKKKTNLVVEKYIITLTIVCIKYLVHFKNKPFNNFDKLKKQKIG